MLKTLVIALSILTFLIAGFLSAIYATTLSGQTKEMGSSIYCADTSIRRATGRLRNGLTCIGYTGKGFQPLKSLLGGITTGRMGALI